MDKVEISQVSNGFIITFGNCHEIYSTFEDVLERLLLHYEGLSRYFIGNSFGSVNIIRGKEVEEILETLPKSEL